jgi:hypothetical protein
LSIWPNDRNLFLTRLNNNIDITLRSSYKSATSKLRRSFNGKNCGDRRAIRRRVLWGEMQSAGFGWRHIVLDFAGKIISPILSQFDSSCPF